jgi:hypothetical protein
MSILYRMSSAISFIFGLFLFLGAAARADIAPDPLNGGVTLKPFDSSTSVAMAEEAVDMTLEPEKLAVRAKFLMENTGSAHDLEVGFPTAYEGELKDFVARVDGKDVAARHEVKAIDGAKKKLREHWIVWKARFEAGKKQTVDVSYWVKPRREMFMVQNMLSSTWFKDQDQEGRYAPRTAGYILKTGAPWKGTIGKAVVTLRLAGGLTSENLRRSSPAGAKEIEGGLVWTFKDFEPTEDIAVTYGRLKVDEEISEFEALDREKGALWTKLHLADLHEAMGDRQKAQEIYAGIIPEIPAGGTVELGEEFTYNYVDFCEKAIALGKGSKGAGDQGAVRAKVKSFLSALMAGKVMHGTRKGPEPIRVFTTPEKKRVEALLVASK